MTLRATDADSSHAEIISFLTKVWSQEGVKVIGELSRPEKIFVNHFRATSEEAATLAIEIDARKNDAYFGCATYAEAGSRKKENAKWFNAFWLDIDCGENKAAEGNGYRTKEEALKALKAFCLSLGVPVPALIVDTGGGWHCYWCLSEGVSSELWLPVAEKLKDVAERGAVKLLADKSRTADRASVLRVPGTHNWKPERNGVAVEVRRDGAPIEFSVFAEKISDAHAKLNPPSRVNAVAVNELCNGLTRTPPPETADDVERVRSMLKAISASIGREQWRQICWAVLSTGWRCAEQLIREWSQTSDKYSEQDFSNILRDFNPNGGAGFGTLVHHAKEAGWIGSTGADMTDIPVWIKKLNAGYAWIEENASIYRMEYSNFIEPARFKQQHDNHKIMVQIGDRTKAFGMGSAWLTDSARRQHKSLVLRPAEGVVTKDNCMNEWRGFSIKPIQGEIKPFLWLLHRLVPDRKELGFVLAWMAHLIQHPEIKMFVSLAFWSHAQGVGKNLLFETLVSIIGSIHAAVIGQVELTADFNGWSNQRIFVIGDEVSGSDKRQETNKLKGLITGTTIWINEKYQPAREATNLMNFVFLSNHHDALFMNDGDRRFFVWEITAPLLPPEKVKEFVVWRDGGGLSALHHYLLNFDISEFNPKAPAPMTEAKQQMTDDNRSDLESWVAELLASDVSQVLGRELATATELGKRYEHDTGHKAPSSRAIVGACKRAGAYARQNQVRLASGKKVRVLSLVRPDFWKQQLEADWSSELAKAIRLN